MLQPAILKPLWRLSVHSATPTLSPSFFETLAVDLSSSSKSGKPTGSHDAPLHSNAGSNTKITVASDPPKGKQCL